MADFWSAVDEAERARRLAIWGVHALRDEADRKQRHLAAETEGPSEPPNRELEAAKERSALAEAEIANEHPFLNAMTLVSLFSALDALVEELVPGAWHLLALDRAEKVMRSALAQIPLEQPPRDEDLDQLRTALADEIIRRQPSPSSRPSGSGSGRYEAVLARVGLQAPPDRAIPQDLDTALAELGAIRDVVVHRASRIDARALELAPTLRWGDGELIQISREDFQRYSAAVVSYGQEVIRRLLGPGDRDLGSLTDCPANYALGG